MVDRRAELRSYYEAEASARIRRPLDGRRVEVRSDFIGRLRRDRRTTVVEVGAGPGRDGRAFVEAGLSFHGVDLAHENCHLASHDGVTVIQGVATDLPFRDGAFSAGWSMSTLMHLDDHDMVASLHELARVVERGAPCVVGIWGGDDRESVDETSIDGQRRRFHLRTAESNLDLVSVLGEVERHEVWRGFPDRWEYHLFEVRRRGAAP